jgi:hypothetical protein
LKEGSAYLHVLVLELDEGPTQLHALLEVVHDALPGRIGGEREAGERESGLR